ncbi:hypothetical protein COCC4DRAFT_24875 [Bipolaris maydis ATCC 48331]|uniref:C-CAP/cofactor C-like domain-containing protein n=2 Tax=Cochliobolus heterostrophus TaxID=5016 RepID=M2UEG2_COCH5|nr:uncharacterized protein COCC4DRAFT_24875 [Bipolaris maydis ATCC 48331]EMD96929.1 hypothetical protein COCHEDRAFT_1123753 [Bipolaris maydis C5]KAJ5031205.1 tubulin binding cofactor C-domain-containing protein [Bipolaris maydis]ENI03799.1 hypothetical protein COCC4DRAFT_24875 [Bipolaris maydis ATCC 48331]KAJ5052900.1 tubulin folding cofactor C [Bipolaris maydis]KAJ6201427.1 tubulin folding cofactor C [Bipolaris maydis]
MSESNLKETFYRKFQDDVASLGSQISSLPDTPAASRERNEAIEQCLAGIDRLSHDVMDASSYLPAYDQRTYSEAIKSLSEKLQTIRNAFDPPKKFSFKNKRKEAAAASSAPAPAREPTSTSIPPPSLQQDDTPSHLTHKSSTRITLASVPSATNSPTVSHLTNCIVNLTTSTKPLATLYLRSIKNSLILCGHVAGPIHITHVTNSVIVTSCRQFRMHDSKNVDIYLHSASRPIFEDCEALRFAPLPGCYVTPQISESPNLWDQIDDFKWLKAEPSPHFSTIPEDKRIPDHVWSDIVPEEKAVSLQDVLTAVNIQS